MGSRPVWRVRDRASFDALRRNGRRSARGPVTVTVTGAVPVPVGSATHAGDRPRVAFSVGRRTVGCAVARNRARRRLRAVVDDLARAGALGANGTWLVSARSDLSELSASELRSAVGDAAAELEAVDA